jgi:hypothetical protein
MASKKKTASPTTKVIVELDPETQRVVELAGNLSYKSPKIEINNVSIEKKGVSGGAVYLNLNLRIALEKGVKKPGDPELKALKRE